MAVTDNTLSGKEKGLLRDYGVMLNLNNKRCDELAIIAKQQVIDTALSNDFDRQTVFDIAAQIDLSQDEAQRAIARYQKRHG